MLRAFLEKLFGDILKIKSLVLLLASTAALALSLAASAQSLSLDQGVSAVDESKLVATSEQRLATLRANAKIDSVELRRLNRSAFDGQVVSITLDGQTYQFTKQFADRQSDGSVTWSGTGLEMSSAVFSLYGDKIYGTIHLRNKVYDIAPLESGVHAISGKNTKNLHIKDEVVPPQSLDKNGESLEGARADAAGKPMPAGQAQWLENFSPTNAYLISSEVLGAELLLVWRVNLGERRATIWMRTVSRLGDDARHLIVAGRTTRAVDCR
jgi:hypothetical protein